MQWGQADQALQHLVRPQDGKPSAGPGLHSRLGHGCSRPMPPPHRCSQADAAWVLVVNQESLGLVPGVIRAVALCSHEPARDGGRGHGPRPARRSKARRFHEPPSLPPPPQPKQAAALQLRARRRAALLGLTGAHVVGVAQQEQRQDVQNGVRSAVHALPESQACDEMGRAAWGPTAQGRAPTTWQNSSRPLSPLGASSPPRHLGPRRACSAIEPRPPLACLQDLQPHAHGEPDVGGLRGKLDVRQEQIHSIKRCTAGRGDRGVGSRAAACTPQRRGLHARSRARRCRAPRRGTASGEQSPLRGK